MGALREVKEFIVPAEGFAEWVGTLHSVAWWLRSAMEAVGVSSNEIRRGPQEVRAEQLWAMLTVLGDHGAERVTCAGPSEEAEEKRCEACLVNAAVEVPYNVLVMGVRAYQK